MTEGRATSDVLWAEIAGVDRGGLPDVEAQDCCDLCPKQMVRDQNIGCVRGRGCPVEAGSFNKFPQD